MIRFFSKSAFNQRGTPSRTSRNLYRCSCRKEMASHWCQSLNAPLTTRYQGTKSRATVGLLSGTWRSWIFSANHPGRMFKRKQRATNLKKKWSHVPTFHVFVGFVCFFSFFGDSFLNVLQMHIELYNLTEEDKSREMLELQHPVEQARETGSHSDLARR